MKKVLKDQMEKNFRPIPQPRGRHHVFRGLNDEDLKRIIELELEKSATLEGEGFETRRQRRGEGSDPRKGHQQGIRRPSSRRAIEGMVEDPLADELLRGHFSARTSSPSA